MHAQGINLEDKLAFAAIHMGSPVSIQCNLNTNVIIDDDVLNQALGIE